VEQLVELLELRRPWVELVRAAAQEIELAVVDDAAPLQHALESRIVGLSLIDEPLSDAFPKAIALTPEDFHSAVEDALASLLQAGLTRNTCAHDMCDVNVTLSIDDRLVERARQKAAALGKSLNQVIRDYLERLAGADDPERDIDELQRLSVRGGGRSRGWKFDREELHERS
jgi:hypothetical protein